MAERTLPPVLDLGSTTSPEFRLLADRVTRWRTVYPALWAKFWAAERGALCIQCGRPELPWYAGPDAFHVNVTVVTVPGSAAYHALQVGGIDALYYADVSADELWVGWCRTCPTPQTEAGWELIVAAALRRAGQ